MNFFQFQHLPTEDKDANDNSEETNKINGAKRNSEDNFISKLDSDNQYNTQV